LFVEFFSFGQVDRLSSFFPQCAGFLAHVEAVLDQIAFPGGHLGCWVSIQRIHTVGCEIPGSVLGSLSASPCCKEVCEKFAGIVSLNVYLNTDLFELLLNNLCSFFHVRSCREVNVVEGHIGQTAFLCQTFCLFQILLIAFHLVIVVQVFRRAEVGCCNCQLFGTVGAHDDLIDIQCKANCFSCIFILP